MEYAWIENGTVTNLIWLHPGNTEDFPNAVPLDGVPAGIGDTWDGAHFYRNGMRVLTQEEADAQTIAAYEDALTDIEKALGVNA